MVGKFVFDHVACLRIIFFSVPLYGHNIGMTEHVFNTQYQVLQSSVKAGMQCEETKWYWQEYNLSKH